MVCAAVAFLFFGIVQSASPPKWEWEPPDQLELAEDDTVDLHCPARGRPAPLVRWSFNTIPFHELPDDGRRILLDQGRLLRIHDLKRDLDTGLYQCNATNAHGYLDAGTFLNVQAFAPRFRHSSQRVWKVLRGTRVDLNCDVEAAPRPTVQWVDANDTQIAAVPSKLEFLTNHTLRLHAVTAADDGFYYCNVSNKYGLNRAMNRLEVFNPTFFAEIPQPAQLALDALESLELRCRAIADVRLTVDYVWTRNGRPTEEKAEINDDGLTSVLRLHQLRGRASGRIECAAITDVDTKVAGMELLVRDVPESPELLRVDCSTGRHALLVWRRPDEHGSPLSAFTIESTSSERMNGGSSSKNTNNNIGGRRNGGGANNNNDDDDGGGGGRMWQKVFEERLLDEQQQLRYGIIGGGNGGHGGGIGTMMGMEGGGSGGVQRQRRKELYKTAIPLAPWMNYTFRMFAHNQHGVSQPAFAPVASPACRTPPDVPFTNPKGVQAAGNELDNLVIRWQPMARHQWNGPGLKYLVRYRLTDDRNNVTNRGGKTEEDREGDGSGAKWHEFFVEDPFANSTIIREQPTFRPYHVQVRAVNVQGFSAAEPDIVLGWSGEDVPLEVPKQLRVLAHHNYTAVTVQWEPVSESSVRGHFQGYRLDYWPSARPAFQSSLFVPNSTNRATITRLDALHNYTARVHVLNAQYESGASAAVEFQTVEGAPSNVHNLRVHAVGANSVLVTWEPPLHANGILRGYFLAFENGTSGLVEETYVLHRQQFYLHELLTPDTPFRVAVWAETGGGEGPRVWRHTRTWPLRDPDPPLFSVRPGPRSGSGFGGGTTSLLIQWLPAGNGTTTAVWRRMAGTSFAVNISQEGTNEWTMSEWITLPQTQLELRGLREGTDYWLVATAREGSTEVETVMTGIESASDGIAPIEMPPVEGEPHQHRRQNAAKPMLIRTESSRVALPFSQERLQSAAWFLGVLIASGMVMLLAAAMCALAQCGGADGMPGSASGGAISLNAIRMRDKQFGPAFRVLDAGSSDGGTIEEELLEEEQQQLLATIVKGGNNNDVAAEQQRWRMTATAAAMMMTNSYGTGAGGGTTTAAAQEAATILTAKRLMLLEEEKLKRKRQNNSSGNAFNNSAGGNRGGGRRRSNGSGGSGSGSLGPGGRRTSTRTITGSENNGGGGKLPTIDERNSYGSEKTTASVANNNGGGGTVDAAEKSSEPPTKNC